MFRSRRAIPYLLIGPGLLWLILFFVVPNVQMLLFSLSEGTLRTGFKTPPEVWDIQNYTGSIAKFSKNFTNSIVYGGLATILCFLIGYPLAYAILFLVIAPFFTSFLIRTISWRIILGNDGPFLSVVRDGLGLVPDNFSVIGTPLAVVGGLTYQFLPFMVLPLYVSIEKVDRRLIEAAQDLYAGPWRRGGLIAGAIAGAFVLVALQVGLGYGHIVGEDAAPAAVIAAGLVGAVAGGAIGTTLISQSFIRVTFPLSLPGVFAASILTFIPAIGDYVNAQLLGSPKTQMIGNVIQGRFLDQNDYPIAAALAFILMAGILVSIALYARLLGTEELTGGTA
ncbi:MAG: transrane type-1 protein [Chloroflexi bacterium]|nr:transrane type-1 protein [Chloroflexota bacterium]